MKKMYVLFVLSFSLSTLSFAQTTAKSVLDNVSAKLKTLKGITANFSYTTTDKKGIKRGSVSGQIFIKGQKYYVKQGTTEIYCDGNKTWNYTADSKEVTVADVDEDDSKTLTPQKLLSDFYDKDFTYTLVSSAGNYYEIDMIPVDKRKNFKQVNIFVDKSKNLITKAKVIDKTDNIIQFSLSNINTNAALPDTKFVFDASKYPGVEVISQ
ncbi:MAG: LolA family protein [Chitinophagaceae bacterium]